MAICQNIFFPKGVLMVYGLFQGVLTCITHSRKTFHRHTRGLMPPFQFVRTSSLFQFH